MTNLQKDLQNLYEYNMMLREKLIAAQSMLHSLAIKESTLAADNGDIITREWLCSIKVVGVWMNKSKKMAATYLNIQNSILLNVLRALVQMLGLLVSVELQ